MILTGRSIADSVESGDIVITPFDLRQVGPNSYDFQLGSRCRTYTGEVLDSARENATIEFDIPPEGLLLETNKIYLVNTLETMGSTKYVPIIRGRSSLARLGVFINITADLIDLGSINQWTLQLHAVLPTIIYPGMRIGQVTFWHPKGEIELYGGKYAKRQSPVPSLAYLDYIVEEATNEGSR